MNRRLADAFAPMAERLRPDDAMRRERAVSAAIDPDGNVVTPALGPALRLLHGWYLPGPLATGSNVERELVWPQAATLRSLTARCKVAPVGSELTVQLAADGVTVASVSVQAGQTSGTSPLFGAALAAGQVVTLNVTAAGSTTPAEDLSLTLAWSPA